MNAGLSLVNKICGKYPMPNKHRCRELIILDLLSSRALQTRQSLWHCIYTYLITFLYHCHVRFSFPSYNYIHHTWYNNNHPSNNVWVQYYAYNRSSAMHVAIDIAFALNDILYHCHVRFSFPSYNYIYHTLTITHAIMFEYNI